MICARCRRCVGAFARFAAAFATALRSSLSWLVCWIAIFVVAGLDHPWSSILGFSIYWFAASGSDSSTSSLESSRSVRGNCSTSRIQMLTPSNFWKSGEEVYLYSSLVSQSRKIMRLCARTSLTGPGHTRTLDAPHFNHAARVDHIISGG